MTIEIILSVIGVVFLILVVFFVIALVKVRNTLKKMDRVLHDAHHFLGVMTKPTVETMEHINKLTVDITKKSEGLDVLFRPLYLLKKGKAQAHQLDGVNLPQIIGYVIEGIRIFNKIRAK